MIRVDPTRGPQAPPATGREPFVLAEIRGVRPDEVEAEAERALAGTDTVALGATRGEAAPGMASPIRPHPSPAETNRVGGVSPDVLRMDQLAPVSGALAGAPMAVADQPESFSRPGLLLSTIGPVEGRQDTVFDFPGEARLYGLSGNKTGRPVRNWVAVQNTSDTPLELTVRGTTYSKHVTRPTTISPDYNPEGGFVGPHAITGLSFLERVPGRNGYAEETFTIPPGETKLVRDVYQEAGGEVFHILDLEAKDPSQTFRIANGATASSPSASELDRLSEGAPGAGIPENFYPAGENALGRPHGIVNGGQRFEGGRTLALEPGERAGELFLATRFKNAGSTAEVGRLDPTGGVPPAAYAHHPNVTHPRNPSESDGNYGTTYELEYTLENRTAEPLVYEVYLTAPRQGNELHRPGGGELTLPVRVNDEIHRARVNARGEGVMLGAFVVPPGGSVPVRLETTNQGNTFPPAGFEFRARSP